MKNGHLVIRVLLLIGFQSGSQFEMPSLWIAVMRAMHGDIKVQITQNSRQQVAADNCPCSQ